MLRVILDEFPHCSSPVPTRIMLKKILLTSFDVWQPDQISNASDDLVQEVLERHLMPENVQVLRKIPVDFQLAPERVIAAMKQLTPDVVLCCGVGATRQKLNLESGATQTGQRLQTTLDLEQLSAGLPIAEISHDAGDFVCNGLYYALLEHLYESDSIEALFLHVPVLAPETIDPIVLDFVSLLQRLGMPAQKRV